MELQAYIDSGILEQYALGLLNENELEDVAAKLVEYPELNKELKSIELSLEKYAKFLGISAPPEVRENLRTQLRSQQRETTTFAANSKNKWIPLLLAIASVLTLVFLMINVYSDRKVYRSAAKVAEAKADSISTAYQQLASDCGELQAQLDKMLSPNARQVDLKGTDLSPTSFAKVIYDQSEKSALLTAIDLPKPPANSQYQLWAIIDGKPANMGTIPLAQTDKLLEVPYFENCQAFAVTLEPLGGKDSPTLDKMYIHGEV